MSEVVQTPPLTQTAEHIVRTAAALFAERGYHGVTTRQIAAAVGLNIATVHYHVGTKRELYHKVYAYLDAEDQAFLVRVLDPVKQQITQGRPTLPELVSSLVDSTVDFLAGNPSRIRFYIRYWLDAEQESMSYEAETTARTNARMLFARTDDIVQMLKEKEVIRLDADTGLFLRGVVGLTYMYFLTGTFDWRTLHSNPRNPDNLQTFKKFLCNYVCRMLGI